MSTRPVWDNRQRELCHFFLHILSGESKNLLFSPMGLSDVTPFIHFAQFRKRSFILEEMKDGLFSSDWQPLQ